MNSSTNASNSTTIAVIGSINTDMVVKTPALPTRGETVIGGDFFMSAGGKGANQAVAAARLGANVSMVANLGTDMFGDSAIKRLNAEGIDCSCITRDGNQSSGVALISVDEKGENHIVVAPGSNGTLSNEQIEQAFNSIPDNSLVLLQLEIPIEAVARAVELANEKHCQVVLDPAPAQELPDAVYAGTYLFTPNETEAEILTGISVQDEESANSAAEKLVAKGIDNVAITLGAKGVLLLNKEGREFIPAVPVDAIDTTAAGDCFNGSLAAALASGKTLKESLAFACKAAAIAVTRLGAQDSMPHAHEL